MIVFPNAKINIGLYITGKRSDGFHDLETFFYPIGWRDVLEILPSKQNRFFCYGKVPEGAGTNIVVKAYKLIAQYLPFKLKIALYKNIPSQAGLGGGSSDAAFFLRAVNEMLNLKRTNDELRELALQLGSDCPFFIENRPSLAYGRGELLKPYNLNLTGFHLIVIKPKVNIPTAEAFKHIGIGKPEVSLEEAVRLPVDKWKDTIFNVFEDYAFSKYPQLKEIKEKLYNAGALYASMSGSGSAIYALFDNKPDLNAWKNYEFHYECIGR